MRWLRPGEVPTLGNWFRTAGYDTQYDGKWHISHADLRTGHRRIAGDQRRRRRRRPGCGAALPRRRSARAVGFSGWVGPEPHGAAMSNSGFRRDPLIADRVVAWLRDRYARRRAGDPAALRPFLLVASFVNPHDIVLFPAWSRRGPVTPSPAGPAAVPRLPPPTRTCATKPAAQIAFREAYYSGYGPAPTIGRTYSARRSSTATCTTAYTPRWTGRWTGCGAPSPRAGRRTPCWCVPPITAICSAHTAACTRSGSTSTTRPPACPSS